MFTFALMPVTVMTVQRTVGDQFVQRHRGSHIRDSMIVAPAQIDLRCGCRTAIIRTDMRMMEAAAQHHVHEQQVGRQM